MDVVVYGNIPNGSGLSSSASLELLFGVLYSAFWSERPIPTLTLVEACVWCENDFFGLHTGIMDQYVIGFGKAGHAMVLDLSLIHISTSHGSIAKVKKSQISLRTG